MISTSKNTVSISVYIRLFRYLFLGLALFLIDTALDLSVSSKINDIVRFQIIDIAPISESCSFDEKKYRSFIDLGLDLCDKPLRGDNRSDVVRSFWEDNVENEDELLHVFLSPRGPNGTNSILKGLVTTQTIQRLNLSQGLIAIDKITQLLTDDEIKLLKGFIKDWTPELPGMIESLSSKLNASDVEKIRLAFGKNRELITEPLLFFKFLNDKEKAAVLTKIQKLLPEFYPSEVNAVLQVKKAFDEIPRLNELITDAFHRFSIEFFLKFLSVDLTPEEESGLQIMLDTEGRFRFLKQCSRQNFTIKCINHEKNLCPSGHISFGLLTLAAMAVPGILFGISEFVHFKHFRFGDFKVLGLQWSFMVKIMVLPLYVTVMIPFFFFITIWNYIKLISNIFLDLLGRDDSNRFTTGLGLYIKFQSLEGMGETFLQIILQLYFLCILVFLGTGTLIAGINAQEFLSDV
ncbi:unnamed protein product, partial [Lepeophtheirus salmonis]